MTNPLKSAASAKTPRWSAIRKSLKDWSNPAPLALVKDLYDASAENRHFLRARFEADSIGGPALETYRRKVVEQFFPKRGFGDPRPGKARKVLRDDRKATGSIPGTIDLLLSCVENGAEFTAQFGDIEGPFCRCLESAAEEMKGPLPGEENAPDRIFRKRIVRLERYANKIGWGYGDYPRDFVVTLEDAFSEENN